MTLKVAFGKRIHATELTLLVMCRLFNLKILAQGGMARTLGPTSRIAGTMSLEQGKSLVWFMTFTPESHKSPLRLPADTLVLHDL